MRLINVDITDSEICDKVQEISTNADVYLVVRKVLASFPTVEAKPIRHGVWIKRYTDGFCNGVRNYKMICPFCDYSYLDNHIGLIVPEYFNYCPNCGAKMDGKENT